MDRVLVQNPDVTLHGDETSVRPRVAVVIGGGGIGTALAAELARRGADVAQLTRRSNAAVDVTDEASIQAVAERVARPLDLVIVATGLLHAPGIAPEKTYRAIDPKAFAEVLRVNTIGPALVAKHFMPLLARDRRSVFAALSARVGSIGDNRLGGWHAYRASKAALNQLIRCFAIEMRTKNPLAIVAGLHPGTVDTALSAPFQRSVPEGKLFTPARSAAAMLDVLDRLGPEDSGGVFSWDSARIPD